MKTPLNIQIFAIDDDKSMTDLLGEIFKMNNIENYKLFNNPHELLDSLTDDVHICIVDYILNYEMNGLDLIKEIVKKNPHCWFIMLSGQSDKKVIIEYLNSVYGSRYIEKNSVIPLSVSLMAHLKDIVKHIYFIDNFYYNATRIKDGIKDLKNLLLLT